MAEDTTTPQVTGRAGRRRAVRILALRLTLIYAAAAIAWIVLSDRVLGLFAFSHDLELWLASAKGLAFVLVTGTLLYFLASHYLGRIHASEEKYARLFENAAEGLTVFRVVRDSAGAVSDLEVADLNPVQARRTGLDRDEAVGRRMSRPAGLDERTRSYFELVTSGAEAGEPVTSELHVDDGDAYEMLEAYPIARDRWALAATDVSEVRRAERALRRQEEDIRNAYVQVLDAVTGGKLVLLTEEELGGELGTPLTERTELTDAKELGAARRRVAAAAEERFPGWVPALDVRMPVCEALTNTLKHAGGGSYRVYAAGDRLQVEVRDAGRGIDFRTLPRAALVTGYSTGSSLGVGFTIMLQSCVRVLLSTRPGRTSVVLEFLAPQASVAERERTFADEAHAG